MRASLVKSLSFLAKPAVAIGGAIVIGGGLVAYALVSTSVTPGGQVVTVARAPITQEVDVTGQVKAAHSTNLAFETAGRVASINVAVGDHVYAGKALISLDGAAQSAALAQAKANLEIQQARLASLRSGTRPEQISIDETNLTQARSGLVNAMQSAYVAADDAVHVKADALFTSPRTSAAALTINVPDQTLVNTIEGERVALQSVFTDWQSALASADSDPAAAAAQVSGYLAQTSAFLDNLAAALAETPAGGSLSASTLSAYKASVNAGRSEVSAALGGLTGVTPALTAYKNAEGALALAKAGPTADDIQAQQAAVDAASAAVKAAQVSVSQTTLTAPVAGTITAQNADPGETVTPGVPMVSMVADGKYQADARVSEADISKVKVGQPVTATFDAYPGATFPAKVTTVDPAATVENGVSSYGVTVTFDKDDPRLSQGLSANLHIVTATKQDALVIPASAVIRDGSQAFVYAESSAGTVKTPVTTGIESSDGMVEITSGLTEGQKVLAYGAQ